MEGKTKLFVRIVCLCLAILLICGLMVSSTLTNKGSYKVREVKVQIDGYTLEGTIFIPKVALTKGGTLSSHSTGENVSKAPALVVQGGGSANRYFFYPHLIELVKRGFVVFAIDAYTHGASEDFSEGWGVYSQVHDALKYLHTLNFVDDANVGYMGHSQGGSATMMALKEYAGYYTLQDKLLNMLHDELGVVITLEQVAAQDADAVAASLGEYEKGYYESRKAEIVEEFNDTRVSFGVMIGMATGAAPPLSSKEFNNVDPAVVEVGGVPVMRNIQANIGNIVTYSDESIGMNALKPMSISSTKELATSPYMRAFFGTGDSPVQIDTIYSVPMPATEEAIPSEVLCSFGEASMTDASVAEASANHTLRMLTMYTGWHNTNHFSQRDIHTAANFLVLATGFNNGYLDETGGKGAIAFNDTKTWQGAVACTVIAYFTLIALMLSLTAVLFGYEPFKKTTCTPIEPQVSKKSAMVWIFTAIVVILPVLLITPLMNNNPFKPSAIAKFDRIIPIAFWSVSCAVILLGLMIFKWYKFDKKSTTLSFAKFYGVETTWKTLATTILGMFIVWGMFVTAIEVYYTLFNSANFTVCLPAMNMLIQITPISTARYIDYLLYMLYFLPYWVVGGMLVNSARMNDMPDWLNTVIITLFNLVPIGLFVYISYMGNIATGGTVTVLGLNWATLIQMCGLAIAIPVGVINSRVLFNRTGSAIPGAILNTIIFTIPFMCTVVSVTGSLPVHTV